MKISPKQFERSLTFLLSLCCVGLFLKLAWPTFAGKIYTYDDLGLSHLAFRHFYSQSLTQGDRFLWCPLFHCGMYLHGDGLVGMYHPLHLFLYKFLPLAWAFNLEFLISYIALFLGMAWMLGLWGIPRHSALLGALIFTF